MDSALFNLEYQLSKDISGQYAEAAITSNPNVTWIKFVFTDDQPNGNKQRIPLSEFDNIIKSGVHMPIKSQPGNPDGKHALSRPIGTITNLVHPPDSNNIIGLAALWSKEYPEDVSVLKEKYSNDEPLNLSWEVFYSEASKDDDGVENLIGTTVQGITFVGNPSYQGRTPVISMAEQEKTEDKTLEIEQLEAKNDELKGQIEDLKAALEEKESALSELQTAHSELVEWKESVEAEQAKAELLNTRRNELAEAGVEFTDEEFETKREYIAAMEDEYFNFYKQEMVSFAEKLSEAEQKKAESSQKEENPDAPDVPGHTSLGILELSREALKSLEENK